MSHLKDVVASLGANSLGLVNPNTVGDPSNYNVVITVSSGYNAISQCSRCQWDWTPFRHYGVELRDGSWSGFLINHAAGYTVGATSIDIDGGSLELEITAGMYLSFDGCPGIYTVVSGFTGLAGTVTIAAPGLTFSTDNPGPLADNRRVVLTKLGRRVFAFSHSHSAQSLGWPIWCCYEEATNKWYNLDCYRIADNTHDDTHPGGGAYDPVQIELVDGYFHQNNANSINVAKQIFYRQYTGINPSTVNRIDISPFVPRDIGRLTHRNISGTLTFTPGTQTVTGTSGSAFMTELTPGDQIWGATDSIFSDTDYGRYGVTVKTISSNTQLTTHNWYNGPAVYSGPGRALNPYDMQTHWAWEPGCNLGGGGRPTGEYWPERDSLWLGHGYGSSAAIQEKRTGQGCTSDWFQRYSYAAGDIPLPNNGGDSAILHYNTARRCLLWMTGVGDNSGADGAVLYEIRCNDLADPIEGGTHLTVLDPIPVEGYYGTPSGGFYFHCPICGVYLFIQPDWAWWRANGQPTDWSPAPPFKFFQIDPSQPSGSQFSMLDSSAFPKGFFNPYRNDYQTADGGMFGAMPDLGAIAIMNYGGFYAYKHCANGRAANGLTSLEKSNFPGVWHGWRWGDNYTHKPTWNPYEDRDPQFAAAMSGYTNYSGGDFTAQVYNWGAESGLRARPSGGDGAVHPHPVTSPTFKGQSASMQFRRPLQVGDSVGWAHLGLTGLGAGVSQKIVSPTQFGLSSQFFSQYAIRMNPALFEQQMVASYWQGNCWLDVVGNTIRVDRNTKGGGPPYPYEFDSRYVGKHLYIHSSSPSNWRYGFYTISAVPDVTHLTLDKSPVNSGTEANAGTATIEWIFPIDDISSSSKEIIHYGNLPHGGTSSTDLEITTQWHKTDRNINSWISSKNFMNAYAIQGNQGFGSNAYGTPIIPDTWHTINEMIEYRLPGNVVNLLTPAVGRRGWQRADWTSGGAGSLVIHSNQLQSSVIAEEYFLNNSFLYITGYGAYSAALGASKWVSGIYKIANGGVNLTTGAITLTTSPTPSGAGAEGEIFILMSKTPGLSRDLAKYEIDGIQNVWFDYVKMSAAPHVDGSSSDRYGIAQIDLIPYQNGADACWINPLGDGYTYFSDLIFSGQPIPYETAATTALGLDIVTTSPLPTGIVGTSYSKTLVASGGTSPYTWLKTSGTWPAGLAMSAAGVITGTPTSVESQSVTIQVTDSAGTPATDSQVFSITITLAAALTITTTSPLPPGTVGAFYSTTLAATGGTSPYMWSIASGTLPGGLTLASSGLISGTPTTVSTVGVTFQVTDSAFTSITKVLSITINPAGTPGATLAFYMRRLRLN